MKYTIKNTMSKAVLNKFAKRLKHLRMAKNMSQDDLSFAAGISRSTIGMVETAKRDITLDKLSKLAKALDVEIYELLMF